jgi:hypothetical protein
METCLNQVYWVQFSASGDCVRFGFCTECNHVHIASSHQPNQVFYLPITEWLAKIRKVRSIGSMPVNEFLPPDRFSELVFTANEWFVFITGILSGDRRADGLS